MCKRLFELVFMGGVACMAASGPEAAETALKGPAASSRKAAEDSLKIFLQNYLKTPSAPEDRATRFVHAFFDLNGDGTEEAIVYICGEAWCGSGGCTTLILTKHESAYRVITRITITRPPIRVLAASSNGWRNLGVWVEGGGIGPGYESELRFNGRTYPSNPSAPPARRLRARVPGETVIRSSQQGRLLYQ